MKETLDQVRQITDEAFKIADISIYQRAYNFWSRTPEQRNAFIERALSWTIGSLGNKAIVDEALKQIGLSTRDGFPEITSRLPEGIAGNLVRSLAQGDSYGYLDDVVKVADRIPGLSKLLPDAVSRGFAEAVRNKKTGTNFMQSFLKAGIKKPELLNDLAGHHVSEPALPNHGYGHAVVVITETPNINQDNILIYDLKGSDRTPIELQERWQQSMRPAHKKAMLGALTGHFARLSKGEIPSPVWVPPLASKAFVPKKPAPGGRWGHG